MFAPTHPVLAALDYRSNDLFRYTFGSEDQLSNKILIAFLSDLLGIRIVRLQIRESEPVKANEGEKGIRFDLLVDNLEMQNYRMKGSLSLRSQAYLSRMVSSQIVAGENYEFCPVIQI
uniref:PD-(D/E)XK nuclease family transposase n=1 Tax=Holdemania filiformis TaxID=61171 RepID=UPI0022E9269F